jgi:opacity protein-like surface antigen
VLNATSVMVNAWPELSWGDFSVYAGGGLGGAYVSGLDDETITPATQVGAGLTWQFSDAFEADLGYRYFTTARFDLDRQDGRYHAHGPVLSLIWHFGQ